MPKNNTQENDDDLDLEDEGQDADAELDADEEGEEDRGDDVNPEDGDEDALAELANEDDGKKKGKQPDMIPYARFTEANEARIRAEARAELLEQQRQQGAAGTSAKTEERPKFDMDAKESEYLDAMMEGDKDVALKIRREINAELARQAREEARADAVQEVTTSIERTTFTNTVAAVIEDYPFLDSKSDEADAAAIAEVVEWRDFYMTSKKMTPSAALRQAADRVAKAYGVSEEDADEDSETKPKPTKASIAALRRAQGLRRNADTSRQQPASMGAGHGNRSELAKLNPETLGEDDFAKLTEKQKAKMRGDVI